MLRIVACPDVPPCVCANDMGLQDEANLEYFNSYTTQPMLAAQIFRERDEPAPAQVYFNASMYADAHLPRLFEEGVTKHGPPTVLDRDAESWNCILR